MAVYTDRGSGTPATTNTTWSTVTNAVDGTPPANPATYTVWTNTTANAVGTIEVGGYDFSTVIGAGDTLNSVTVNIRHLESQTTRLANVQFQPYDGATPIGTLFTATRATSARDDSTTFPVTLAQLRSANFKVRVTATRFNGTQAGTFSLDHIDVTADYTPPVPSITQAAYQFFDDAGTESGAAALVAQDTPVTATQTGSDGFGMIRVRLQSTSAIAIQATDDFALQYEKNASGTWLAATSGAVVGYDNPNLTEGAATTNRLTGGTGTFSAGKVSEAGNVANVGWSGNNFTEILYSVRIVAAQCVNGDTLRFRVVLNGATTNMTYTVTPTINIVVLPSTWTGSAGSIGVAGTSGSFSEWAHPIPEAGLYGWYDADDASTFALSGTAVTQWRDKSSILLPLDQTDPARKPDRSGSQNGHTSVKFDADFMVGMSAALPFYAYLHDGTDYSIFIACKLASGNTYLGIMGTTASAALGPGFDIMSISANQDIRHGVSRSADIDVVYNTSANNVRTNGQWNVFSVFADPDNATQAARSTIRVDGGSSIANNISAMAAPSTASPANPLTIGTRSAGDIGLTWLPAGSEIGEIVIYNRILTGPEIIQVDNYLEEKWLTVAGPGGKPKVWSGSTWAEKPVKVWTGSAWVEKPLKVWTGSSWVLA